MGEIESALEESGELDDQGEPVEAEAEEEEKIPYAELNESKVIEKTEEKLLKEEEERAAARQERFEKYGKKPEEGEEGEEDDEPVEIDEDQVFVLEDGDGQEIQVSMKELQEGYQRSQMVSRWQRQAQATLTQAEQKEGELRTVLQNWLQDPFTILEQAYARQTGNEQGAIDKVRQMTTEYLRKALDEETMSEDQKEFLREKRAWERQKKEDEMRRQRESQETRSTLQAQYEEQLSQDIKKAREETGLPDIPEVNEEIANVMLLALDAKQELTAREAAAIVRQDRQKKLAQLMNSADAERLAEEFPEASRKVSRVVAKGMQRQKPGVKGKGQPPSPVRARRDPRFNNSSDWREALWQEI